MVASTLTPPMLVVTSVSKVEKHVDIAVVRAYVRPVVVVVEGSRNRSGNNECRDGVGGAVKYPQALIGRSWRYWRAGGRIIRGIGNNYLASVRRDRQNLSDRHRSGQGNGVRDGIQIANHHGRTYICARARTIKDDGVRRPGQRNGSPGHYGSLADINGNQRNRSVDRWWKCARRVHGGCIEADAVHRNAEQVAVNRCIQSVTAAGWNAGCRSRSHRMISL